VVVQELAFSRLARLHCGTRAVDWDSFADAVTLFGQRQQDVVTGFSKVVLDVTRINP